ncbi:hypothetical protein D9M71_619170 [compost metagenome]
MPGGQGQQPISQGCGRTEQEIPENHRKKALVGLPQQVALHPFQHGLGIVGGQTQVAFGDMHRCLLVAAPPGVAKRSLRCLDVATAEAVDQHQQVHRQGQQAIGHRLQHVQEQGQQRHRQQHQDDQYPPGMAPAVTFKAGKLGNEKTIALQTLAQGRELLEPQHQQQHQKTHVSLSLSLRPAR